MTAALEPTAPPAHLIRSGELGEELIVLTRPELRRAERLVDEKRINTADGVVTGSPGDFEVFTSSGEGYPVQRSVFLGVYELRGDVGGYVVGRRLIHARRAWPIVSPSAEFSYASGRGTVAHSRGGWVYRSDEDDFGLINKDENLSSHAVVGTVARLRKGNWARRVNLTNKLLLALPPVLSLLALLALVGATGIAGTLISKEVGAALLAIEGYLLVAAMVLLWWSRRQAWGLRAAFEGSSRIVSAFQVAAAMLGERRSSLFPSMAIWRAAQSDSLPARFAGADLRELKDALSGVIEEISSELHALERREHVASALALVAALVVIACIALLLFVTHAWPLEIFAIWLPSLIGALHAANTQNQVRGRLEAGQQLLSELQFARERLLQWSSDDSDTSGDEEKVTHVTSTVRLICRMIGEYSQHKVRFEMESEPEVPV